MFCRTEKHFLLDLLLSNGRHVCYWLRLCWRIPSDWCIRLASAALVWYSPGAFSHLLPGLLLLGGVRFDVLSQRAGIGVAFLAALNLTRVWFLKHTGSSNSVSGPPPPLDISVFWIWNVDSPCRHVCAGAWHGRWSCWRLSDSRGADTCTVSLLCGFVSGFWGSLGGRTPSDSLQTNIKKWRRRETSLEMFTSNRFFLYRIDTWPEDQTALSPHASTRRGQYFPVQIN